MNSELDFKSLIANFTTLKAQAASLHSPNPEDHRRIKLAMVGFARSSDVTRWGFQHFEFIQNRLETDLSPDCFSPAWIDISCVAMGCLLGLLDAGAFKTDSEFHVAEMQLPGLMWMHAEEIEALSGDVEGA